MNIRTLFCVALLATTGLAHAVAGKPADIVKATTARVLGTLVDKRADFQANPETLNDFVKVELEAIMDREYSARLVLGPHARGVEPQKLTAFADALTDNLLRRYGKALLDFDPNVEVRVKSETPLQKGKFMRVASEIVRRGGSPVPVDYMFAKDAKGEWKVFDVIVEGVSYVQTYRTQFDEQLRGQTLDQVTSGLKAGAIKLDEGR
jgi:phospholipid transport system substrate-binding protein